MPKVNSSTSSPSSQLEGALTGIPQPFRTKLVDRYLELKNRHTSGQYETAGLSAGKFAETVLRCLQQHLTGQHTLFGAKLPNFSAACRALENLPGAVGPESLRVLVPRALEFTYTLRNKRGIGHTGGDVEANHIDSAAVARVADWVVCELVRVFHALSLEEAQAIVEGLAVRELPSVWEVAGKRRVLEPGLTAKERTLLLLYSLVDEAVVTEDLCDWVEHSNLPNYRRDVLRPLHATRHIEYDQAAELVYLSPTGVAAAEELVRRARAI